MSRYGVRHACRRITIVAGSTIIDDAGMIEGCRHEATGGMTDTAILIGVDMVDLLGGGETGIVTGRAIIYDAVMIEACRHKARSHVAVTAVGIGRYMEVVFAGGGVAIMTGSTVIHDALMFEPGVGKGARGMAHRAILSGRNVVGIGLRCLAGGINAIVTGGTVIHDTGMIEHRRGKAAAGQVTDTAIFAGYNVGRIDLRALADCRHPVMTGVAAGGQQDGVGVVDKCTGKSSRIMTKRAVGRGCRVRRGRRLAPGAKRHEIAVMAGRAITADARVSKSRGCESGDRMAQITILASRQMVSPLG